MASVPGEFDSNAGLDADEQAAIAALAADPKKKTEDADEAEDRAAEREAAIKEGGSDEAIEQSADAEMDDTEERARAMGWVPQSEFKGDPARWRPAAEWLERGFANPYILKSLNDRLDETRKAQAKELDDVKRQLAESTQVVRAINQRFENADRAGYDRALRELKDKQKEAVSEADTDKFDQASKDLEALETRGPPKVLPAPTVETRPQQPQIESDVVSWTEENKWFRTDAELKDYAAVVDRALQREYTAAGKTEADVGARAHLNELARRVKQRYADHEAFKNENPRRAAASSVLSPGGDRGSNGAGSGKPRNLRRTYENLPPDGKEACDKLIRTMGKKKDPETGKMVDYYTREKYCATYDWPQEFY